MKKLITVLLIAAMAAMTLIGCGNNRNGGSNNGSDNISSGDGTGGNSDSATAGVKGLISVVSREEGSGTRGAFIELFDIEEKDANGNKEDHTTDEAIIANSTEVVLSNVAGDPNAIGYVSLGALKDTVKALKIGGLEATVENIRNGAYEISRPFNIVTGTTPSESAQDFIRFILSADGQKVVEDEGYIQTVETPEPFAGARPAGKIVVEGSSSVAPVMEKLIEAYKALNPNAEIELQPDDSTTGIQAAKDGTADIGMASRDLKESESSLTAIPIAMDGIAVIVNRKNTISDMTKEEVKAIFTGEKTIW